MPSRNRKKRSKQRAEYLQKQDDVLSQENYEAPYRTKLIFFYRRDVFHSDSHFTNRNDGFYLSQWWTLLIELKVSIISIAFLSIDRCTHRNCHIDRTITNMKRRMERRLGQNSSFLFYGTPFRSKFVVSI